jgi:hypothetical protein
LLHLFIQKTVTNERCEVIENPDPTSLEFENLFSELMCDALKVSEHKLVLVIDNLDRITPGDALKIWSTLRTFLEHKSQSQEQWLQKLWVLIPYDLDGLKNLWNEKSTNGLLAKSFIEKIFQTRFFVPAPILSDWRAYLIELLKQAFPDNTDEEYHIVYRIYSIMRKDSLTPRQLKLYINGVGALHRQWGDTIPLHHLAVYFLLKNDGNLDVNKIVSNDILDESVAKLMGDNIQDDLAALYYNVEAVRARQILLKQPLEDALVAADGYETILKLSQNTTGFWEVLENELENIILPWVNHEPQLILIASHNLLRSSIFDETRKEVEELKNILIEAITNVKKLPVLDTNVSAGIIAFNKINNDNTFMQRLLEKVSNVTKENYEKDKEILREWINSAFPLFEFWDSIGKTEDYSKELVITSDLEVYLAACSVLIKLNKPKRYWKYILPPENSSKILELLASKIVNGQADDEVANTVTVLKNVDIKLVWTDIANGANGRLMNDGIPSTEMARLIDMLYELSTINSHAETLLVQLVQQSRILNWLWMAHTQNDHKTTAYCMFISLLKQPSIGMSVSYGNSGNGYSIFTTMLQSPAEYPKVFSEFTTIIRQKNSIDMLFNVYSSSSIACNWITACLKQLADDQSSDPIITPKVLLENWGIIRTALDNIQLPSYTVFNDLVGKAISKNLIGYIQEQGFSSEYAGLYHSVVLNYQESSSFLTWCIDGLRKITATEWTNHLSAEDDVVKLLVALINSGQDVILLEEFQDGLQEYMSAIIRGSSVGSYNVTNWDKIIKSLKSNLRKTLAMRIYDIVINQQGDISETFFELYGNELIDKEILHSNRKMVSHLFSRLLSSDNMKGREWLKMVFSSIPDILDGQPAGALEELHNRIRSLAENNEHFQDIAATINMDDINDGDKSKE